MKTALAYGLILMAVAGISYQFGRNHAPVPAPRLMEPPLKSAVAPERQAAPVSVVQGREVKPQRAPLSPDPLASFKQDLNNIQAGYEAAQSGLEEAIKRIPRLPTAQIKGFVTGVFTFIGQNHNASQALGFFQQLPKRAQSDALRSLVAVWSTSGSELNEEQRFLKREEVMAMNGRKLGLEIELAYALASAHPDPDMTKAWLETFSSHPGRAEMLAALDNSIIQENPEALLQITADWAPWEKERVIRNALETMTQISPEKAWQWYLGNRPQFPEDFSSSLFSTWAEMDLGTVRQTLTTLQDPVQRLAAVESIGKVLAGQNTDAAVAWADSLSTAEERDAAHRSIYEAAPRGIGAAISIQDGFPTIRSIIPGSPLEGTGVQPGDRIAEIRASDGSRKTLYGTELASSISMLRGEPGSEITLRVLRPNPATGQTEEHLVSVKRQQLYLKAPGSEP